MNDSIVRAMSKRAESAGTGGLTLTKGATKRCIRTALVKKLAAVRAMKYNEGRGV